MSLGKSSSSSSIPKPLPIYPITPKRRARSKTRPNDPFMLWIPSELEDLEIQIQSKRRTLELLSGQLPPIEDSLQEQILSRDRVINSQNRTILELKSNFSSKELNAQQKDWLENIEKLEKELDEYKKLKTEAETRVFELENSIETLNDHWETEKSELIVMQAALHEENEQLKSIISSKDSELSELDKNISSLQSVIEKMNRLNTDLYSKLEKKNSETEELNIKSYENMLKAKQAEELERNLNSSFEQNLKLEHKISNLLQQINNLTRFNSILEWSEKNLHQIEESIKKQQENLSKIDDQSLSMTLNFFFQDLSNSISTIKQSLQKNKPKEVESLTTERNSRDLLKETEQELEKYKEYIRTFNDRESALLSKIKNFSLIIEKNQVEYKNEILQMRKQSESFNEQFSRFKDKISELMKDNEKNLVLVNESKVKITHLNSELERSSRKVKEMKERERELRMMNCELRKKVEIFMDGKKSSQKSGASEENWVKKIFAQAKILRDEVFRKDSELVKMEREKGRFEREVEGLKACVQNLQGKMKGIEAETLSEINKKFEEKDRQIEILKEMLKSAHCELKTKDTKIQNLQKSSETPLWLNRRRYS